MAEIEIGILDRQCLARCATDQATLTGKVAAWHSRTAFPLSSITQIAVSLTEASSPT
jgi:hypothetical protein